MGVKEIVSKGKDLTEKASSLAKENKKLSKDEKLKQEVKEKISKKINENVEQIKSTEQYQLEVKKDSYKAYVVLRTWVGTLPDEIAVLGSKIVYHDGEKEKLVVENKEGKIIFEADKPDSEDQYIYMNKETIESKIDEIKDTLTEFDEQDLKEKDGLYRSDYEVKLKNLEKKQLHLMLGNDGSFITLRKGVPHYVFDLVGLDKEAIYQYKSSRYSGRPPLQKIEAAIIMFERLRKSLNLEKENAQKILSSLFLVLNVIAFIAMITVIWKAGNNDVAISDNFANVSQTLGVCYEQKGILEENYKLLQNISTCEVPENSKDIIKEVK